MAGFSSNGGSSNGGSSNGGRAKSQHCMLIHSDSAENIQVARRALNAVDPLGRYVREIPMYQRGGLQLIVHHENGPPAVQGPTPQGPSLPKVCVTCGNLFSNSSILAAHCQRMNHGMRCPDRITRINDAEEWRRHISSCLNHN